MLKFRGSWERARDDKKKKRVDELGKKNFHIHQNAIPTVDEVDEFNAHCIADTILQILHGQGIYWGPEARCDNDVPDYTAMFAREEKRDAMRLERDKERQAEHQKVLEERAARRAEWEARPRKARRNRLDSEHRTIIRALMKGKGYTKERATELALQLIPLSE